MESLECEVLPLTKRHHLLSSFELLRTQHGLVSLSTDEQSHFFLQVCLCHSLNKVFLQIEIYRLNFHHHLHHDIGIYILALFVSGKFVTMALVNGPLAMILL